MTIFKRTLLLVLLLSVCGFVLVFCLANSVEVDVNLLFFHFSGVQFDLVVIASFIAGGLSGVLSSLMYVRKIRKKYRVANKQTLQLK